jgi:hypothetical protein
LNIKTKQDQIDNLEFQITFTETNLRYLAGDNPPNLEKIESVKVKIEELKNKLQKLKKI